ncbi:MAG: amidase family protein, partial [Pseudorhodoplanes sp.]
MTNTPPIWSLTATELTEGYRKGHFSPMDAVNAILDRISEVNPRINAVVTLDMSAARAAADAASVRYQRNRPLGPLDGVPITVKDNIHVKGLRSTWGSMLFADYVPGEDELPVARLR